ncbi:MAG TPA: ion transporter [Lysobacter sp.]|nr:ion transporter [Lysobacter sp.]
MRLLSEHTLQPARDDGWRHRWFHIIHGRETVTARNFDLVLIVAIVASVLVIVADSVAGLHARHAHAFLVLEWGFTVLFTVEYLLRLAVVRQPLRYALSFWGVIDLLSILPSYLSLLLPGSQSLLVVRVLRMLRLFRILKLTRYIEEGSVLTAALWRSRRKILVFLFTVVTLVVVFGALMYVIEGPEHGFDSIPEGMYWAVVTVATVGFGDIAPVTPLGRLVASALILIGYGIIAVPTGIYTAELAVGLREAGPHGRTECAGCGLRGHQHDALHCRGCGATLPAPR